MLQENSLFAAIFKAYSNIITYEKQIPTRGVCN